MKADKRIISLLVAGSILGGFVSPMQTYAAVNSTEKEEVVYANLASDGSAKGAYIVNIFKDKKIVDYGEYDKIINLNTADKLVYSGDMVTADNSQDRLYYEGILSQIELPWDIQITYTLDGKEYKAEELSGKSGKLGIHISIQKNEKGREGFFDNYAVQATCKLDTNLCKNIKAKGATLANVGGKKQLTYTVLPGKGKEINIEADVTDFEMDSIAINGVRMQLGLDKDMVEPDSLTGEVGKVQNAVKTLDDGANRLNHGTKNLYDGLQSLQKGSVTIEEGLKKLCRNSTTLTGGSGKFNAGINKVNQALSNVKMSANEVKKLTTASAKISKGIDSLVGGLEKMQSGVAFFDSSLKKAGVSNVAGYVAKQIKATQELSITQTQRKLYEASQKDGKNGALEVLKELAEKRDAEAVALYGKVQNGDTNAFVEYLTTAGKLIGAQKLLAIDVAYIKGSNQVLTGIRQALDEKNGALMKGAETLQSGYHKFDKSISKLAASIGNLAGSVNQLKAAVQTLTENYGKLDFGINQYTEGVKKITGGYENLSNGVGRVMNGAGTLYKGTTSLSEGTGAFLKESGGMKDKVNNQIEEMIEQYSNQEYETVSFVSDKNTKVNSVQFVLQTPKIEKEEEKVAVKEKAEEKNLWQKFIALFGF